MVRKILPALLIALALASCAEAKKEEVEIDRGEDVVISEIPFSDIKYNESKIGLNSVALYQDMDETYHYYHPWVIVHFDRSDLEDYQINRMFEVRMDFPLKAKKNFFIGLNEFRCLPEYSSAQNDISGESIPLITKYLDGNEIVFIYYDYKNGYRKDLTDMQVSLKIDVVQEDTYTEDGKDLLKINMYTADVSSDVLDSSEISEKEMKMFERGAAELMSR